MASIADETPSIQDNQLLDTGTRLEPSIVRADRPRAGRSRGSNKIDEKREDVVDEEALKEMFKSYDKKADNAIDIHLEGSGRLIAEMGGKQTHKLALHLISRAVHDVVLTAPTFDLTALAEALKDGAARGVRVMVYADRGHTLTGATQAMPARLGELIENGINVRLCRGDSGGSGIQHSKTLQCDQMIIIGSANWTNSSQSNQEISVLQALNLAGLRVHAKRIEEMHEVSEAFSEAETRETIETRAQRKDGNARARARSVPAKSCDRPDNKYTTARRFQIANDIRRNLADPGQK